MTSLSMNGVMQGEYEYNHLGQQIIRRLPQDNKTIHNIFDFNGNRIAEYEIDDATGVQTLLREYVWLDDMPVAVIEGGEVYYVRTDHIGRPSFASDGNGTEVWSVSYLPFGGVYVETGDAIGLRFPGQWFQAESGLYQNWMRDYDPTTGRYMQADPLGLIDGASVYGYARQSPNRYTDPTGQCPWCVAAAAGAIVGAGLNVLHQLIKNGGHFECVNWADAGAAGAVGALGGGFTGAWSKGILGQLRGLKGNSAVAKYRKLMGIKGRKTEVHHGIFSAGGKEGRRNSGFQHSWWNFKPLPKAVHDRMHKNRPGPTFRRFSLGRWYHGTPTVFLGAEISVFGGNLIELLDKDPCYCDN